MRSLARSGICGDLLMNGKDEKLPIVSVIMPNFNGGQYLHSAIASILEQSFFHFELIIIDDGSTDNSIDVINSFDDSRIILVKRSKNCGLVRRLNEGIALASGKYIARMDSDDISHPDRLQRQIDFLESSAASCVGCNYSVINSDGEVVDNVNLPQTNDQIYAALSRRCPFVHGAIVFNKDVFLQAGAYQKSPVEDYDLWLRFAQINVEFYNLPDNLYFYRMHSNSVSSRSHLRMIWSAARLRAKFAPAFNHPAKNSIVFRSSFLDYFFKYIAQYPHFYKLLLYTDLFARIFKYYARHFLKILPR